MTPQEKRGELIGGFCIVLMIVGAIGTLSAPVVAFFSEVKFAYVLLPAQFVFFAGLWLRRWLTKETNSFTWPHRRED